MTTKTGAPEKALTADQRNNRTRVDVYCGLEALAETMGGKIRTLLHKKYPGAESDVSISRDEGNLSIIVTPADGGDHEKMKEEIEQAVQEAINQNPIRTDIYTREERYGPTRDTDDVPDGELGADCGCGSRDHELDRPPEDDSMANW